jgi:hypothetical protein
MSINQCRCGDMVYLDKWGTWRHYSTGVMLCQDEAISTEVAAPRWTDAELEAFEDHEWHEEPSMHPDCPHC